MKTLLILISFLLLTSCIPYSEYSKSLIRYEELDKEYTALKKKKNQLNEEYKLMDRKLDENIAVIGEILEKKTSVVFAINEKLKKNNVDYNVYWKDISEMNIHQQYYSDRYYFEFMKKNPCKNPDIARNIPWLSEKEKDCYYWLNYARMNPKEFCDKHIVPLLGDNEIQVRTHIVTLINYMYEMRPLNALTPDKKAYESAKCHAKNCGYYGLKTEYRMNNCKDLKYNESISYGDYSARDHIIRLLLDLENPNLENRYNCLDFYSSVGIASSFHFNKEEMIVFDFDKNEKE
jgi:hypothetical protein